MRIIQNKLTDDLKKIIYDGFKEHAIMKTGVYEIEEPPIISLLSTLTEGGIKTINEIESDTNRINNLKNIYELQSNIKENLITVSPFLCKPWYLVDRLEVEMGNIEELSLSIQKMANKNLF